MSKLSEQPGVIRVVESRAPTGLASPAACFSRRGLLGGAGLAAAAALLPKQAYGQFDIEPIELSFADLKRAADTMSILERWYVLFDVAEVYARRHQVAQEEDRPALRATTAFLIGSLEARVADVRWTAELTNRQPEAFQSRAMRTIEQSPVSDELKGKALGALNQEELHRRLAEASDVAPAVVDDIEELLRTTSKETGIPRVPDMELQQRWLCIVLQAMLSDALAASQWYLVPSITLQLTLSGCW